MKISPNQLNAQFENVKKLCGADLISDCWCGLQEVIATDRHQQCNLSPVEGSGSQNKSFGKENLIYGEDKETARDLNECLLCKRDASTWQEYVHMRKKKLNILNKSKM